MENVWICVYRDTIENHDENDNLAEVLVSEQVVRQYFKEYISEGKNDQYTFEEFLDEYTADCTVDFYSYAKRRNAVIATRPLSWEDIEQNLLNGICNGFSL